MLTSEKNKYILYLFVFFEANLKETTDKCYKDYP